MIAALGLLMVATAFLSGLFGMAGGMILIGVLLTLMPAWPVGNGCCTPSTQMGVQWLARVFPVAEPHQVAAGREST